VSGAERERYWRGVLDRWAASGASVTAFCEREGVSTASFYNWRKRLGGAAVDAKPSERADSTDSDPPLKRPLFVPVRVTSDEHVADSLPEEVGPPKAAVEVLLPAGIVVRVADGAARGTIADVLSVLGAVP